LKRRGGPGTHGTVAQRLLEEGCSRRAARSRRYGSGTSLSTGWARCRLPPSSRRRSQGVTPWRILPGFPF